MPKSIRLEILDTVIAKLMNDLPSNYLISDNYTEVVNSSNLDALWCHLGNTEVSETQIDNVSYLLKTTVMIDGIYKFENPDEDYERAKEKRIQFVVDALTRWKYMTDSIANFGDLEIQGVNLESEDSKDWETISGLYIGYSLSFSITHFDIRSIFNSPLDLPNLSLWLDLEDSSSVTTQYNAISGITVSGTNGNTFLTSSSATIEDELVEGCKIYVDGNEYIVESITTTTIRILETLSSSFKDVDIERLQISEVLDKSENQTNALQVEAVNEPLSVNDNSAYFISNRYLTVTQSENNLSFGKGNFTIFFKAKIDTASDATIFSEYSQGAGLKFLNGKPIISFLAGPGGSDYSATLANSPTTTNLNNYFTVVNRDTEPALGTEMYVNAQKEEMATPSNISALNSDLATSYDVTIGKLRNGSSSYFTGRFYAMVVCKGILSKLDIERLNKYYSD